MHGHILTEGATERERERDSHSLVFVALSWIETKHIACTTQIITYKSPSNFCCPFKFFKGKVTRGRGRKGKDDIRVRGKGCVWVSNAECTAKRGASGARVMLLESSSKKATEWTGNSNGAHTVNEKSGRTRWKRVLWAMQKLFCTCTHFRLGGN